MVSLFLFCIWTATSKTTAFPTNCPKRRPCAYGVNFTKTEACIKSKSLPVIVAGTNQEIVPERSPLSPLFQKRGFSYSQSAQKSCLAREIKSSHFLTTLLPGTANKETWTQSLSLPRHFQTNFKLNAQTLSVFNGGLTIG